MHGDGASGIPVSEADCQTEMPPESAGKAQPADTPFSVEDYSPM
jgi:hypothetical protein